MTITQARQELVSLRDQEKYISVCRKQLKDFIISKGADIDPDKKKRIKRNKLMYLLWVHEETFVSIAERYDLSPGQAANICHRIERYVMQGKKGYKRLPRKPE